MTTAKIKTGAVTGSKIKLSTLGKVPSAVSADALSGLTAAQIVDAAKLECPAGTKLGGGAVEPEYVDKGEVAIFRGINLTAHREAVGLPFVQISVGGAEGSNPYRCVTPPSNG